MLEFFSACFKRRPHQQPQFSGFTQTTDRSHLSEASSGFDPNFSLQDLIFATRNFHSENLLGEGGFGRVYKGILVDGTEVAVKQLSVASHQGQNEFINEAQILLTVQHRNLVRLFGCCAEGAERLLVYEYLKNKSLDLALFGVGAKFSSFLEWPVRRRIIMGAAKGLKYLHEDSRVRIIHRDIKASNILLDDKFYPKIADFGLAKLFDMTQTHASTKVAGTFGYLAPEYAVNGRLTEKADVYSFGVVILEVVSGRKNTDFHLPSKNQILLDVAWRLYKREKLLDLVDRRMGDRYVPEEAARVIHVALLCTQAAPDLRPSMSRVVYLLSGRSPIPEKPTKPPVIHSESPKKSKQQSWDERIVSGTSGSSTMGSASSFFSTNKESGIG
ncbi:hypothetical protein L7F22_013075 [Adiantum nelumboides]|nr:hypothetical protein [Adiantum nelumboides]